MPLDMNDAATSIQNTCLSLYVYTFPLSVRPGERRWVTDVNISHLSTEVTTTFRKLKFESAAYGIFCSTNFANFVTDLLILANL